MNEGRGKGRQEAGVRSYPVSANLGTYVGSTCRLSPRAHLVLRGTCCWEGGGRLESTSTLG